MGDYEEGPPDILIDGLEDSESPSLSQTQRSAALTGKISSVLSTSYTDAEIREAFAALDERKVRNTPETRRRLRIDAQKDVLDLNGAIVRDFGRVAEQLKQVGSLISSLNVCMAGIKGHVNTANKDLVPILQEAQGLLQQKQEIETKQRLLDAFNQHFKVSDDDLATLTSSSIPVDEEFFILLTKLKKVHADCQVLLGSEEHQLGKELMDQTARTLNSAYEKLFRWIQKEFKTLDIENPRIHASIRRALRVLAQRPSLFQECLNYFSEAREQNLSDAFYTALTGATSQTDDRTAKPMEYYAHDALRFVGDMLAWLHSAAVSERESLEVLFIADGEEIARGLQAGMESEPWTQEDGLAFDGTKTLEVLINRDLAGVMKALRQRIEQVVRSDDDPVLAYKIANLIGFYNVTLVRLVGHDSSVLENLGSLQESALQQYKTAMHDFAGTIPTDSSHAPADLAAPDFLIDAISRLQEIIKTYESSYASPETREADQTAILAEALDPFKESCVQMAAGFKEPVGSIFAINCLSTIRTALNAQGFPASSLSDTEDAIDRYSAELIDYQHAFFTQTSGIHILLGALAPLTDAEQDLLALYKLDVLQTQALTDASQVLDDFLPHALIDAGENIKRLRDPSMAEEITTEAASRFCDDFDQVLDRFTSADALLEDHDDTTDQTGEKARPLRSIFQRTSADVRVLLS